MILSNPYEAEDTTESLADQEPKHFMTRSHQELPSTHLKT